MAGPAALLVAKLTKIEERHDEVANGKSQQRRIRTKDALDIFRLLVTTETESLVRGFRIHASDDHASRVSAAALDYLRAQRARDLDGHIVAMLADELPGDLVAHEQLLSLIDELFDALGHTPTRAHPGPAR